MPRFLGPFLCAAAIALFAGGCASEEAGRAQPSSIRVSSVNVSPGSKLDGADRERLRDRDIQKFIQSKIRLQLASRNRIDSTGPEMDVTIEDFNIRSTGAAVMLGVMAGTDFVEASVVVRSNGKVLKRYTAEAGAVTGYGSEDRALRMCERLAESIAEQL